MPVHRRRRQADLLGLHERFTPLLLPRFRLLAVRREDFALERALAFFALLRATFFLIVFSSASSAPAASPATAWCATLGRAATAA